MTLEEFFRICRHNALLLLAAALVGLAAAAGYSSLQPTLYSSTATGYVVAGSSETVGQASAGLSVGQAKASSYRPIVGSGRVIEAVAKALEPEYGPGAGFSLSGSTVEGSNIFQVSAVARSPKLAKDAADQGMIATAAEALRLDSMTASGESTGVSAVRLVPTAEAGLPGAPFSPAWRNNLIAGVVAGLGVGVALAFLRRALDKRVRTQADLDALTGASVLGLLPRADDLARSKGKGAAADTGVTAEALRQLRTNLRFVSVDDPPRSLVVTSANPGEGKSTVSVNLSRVLAQSGQHVVLVDADLRRPTLHSRLGLDGSVGLTQVLAGDVSLADALQATDIPNLFFLASGRIPPNPSELVGSRRMRQVIDALATDRIVLIDAPPVLPVTDAGLLTASADGAILVVRVGKTNKEQVQQSLRLLKNVNAKLLGSVMNGIQRGSMGTAVYGYGYGAKHDPYASHYGAEAQPTHKTRRQKTAR